jgi:hypothetical protein
MSVAKFQAITGDMIGVFRVFDKSADTKNNNALYKFFTLGTVTGTAIEIIGMHESKVAYKDAVAIADEIITHPELSRFDIRVAFWVHDGKRHEFDVARRRERHADRTRSINRSGKR